MSQLDLSMEAEVSSKHLSFVENGRTQPSRQMVLILASALELPLRERNALLLAAGFAPVYGSADLDDPEMAQVRRTLVFLLRQHEPFSALVIDRHWNVLMANAGHARTLAWLSGEPVPPPGSDGIWAEPPLAGVNLMLSLFDPAHIRRFVVNFEELASAMLAWVYREATGDPAAERLLASLLAMPGVRRDWRQAMAATPTLLVPLVIEKDGVRLRLFSTLTTLGTPQDLLAQELRLETFFPADDTTERWLREAAAGRPLPGR